MISSTKLQLFLALKSRNYHWNSASIKRWKGSIYSNRTVTYSNKTSPTLIKQSRTLLKGWFILKGQSFALIEQSFTSIEQPPTPKNSQPRVYISKIGLLQYYDV